MEISLLKIVESTTVDGPGLRTAVYAAGCSHRCRGCHNPQSWDIEAGRMMSVEGIAERLLNNRFEDVTFTGGDPMYQAEGFAELADRIRRGSGKSIWCYTGYRIEVLLNDLRYMPLLERIDVLVDGPYMEDRRDTGLLFRGSSNQRIIDVCETLKRGAVVEYNPLARFEGLLKNTSETEHNRI